MQNIGGSEMLKDIYGILFSMISTEITKPQEYMLVLMVENSSYDRHTSKLINPISSNIPH